MAFCMSVKSRARFGRLRGCGGRPAPEAPERVEDLKVESGQKAVPTFWRAPSFYLLWFHYDSHHSQPPNRRSPATMRPGRPTRLAPGPRTPDIQIRQSP